MCHPAAIQMVKDRMLSRRSFLCGSAAATAGAVIGAAAAAPPALAGGAGGVMDLTHTLTTDFPTYFGEQQYFEEQKFNFAEHFFNLKEIRVNEHTGTHMDAPLHFSADGASVDQLTVQQLVVPLSVVDIATEAESDPDAQVTPNHLRAWILRNGDLPPGGCVAMHSGWDRHISSSKFRNADSEGAMHFPGFHVEAVEMLKEETSSVGIAADTLSLDFGPSPDFATHYAWLGSGGWGLECVAGLGQLPASGATLVVGAPKHAGGTGGPSRLFALL